MPSITLKPTNVHLDAPEGASLRDLLFEQGVEFPCGGHGRCRGCKVRLLAGDMPVNDAQRAHLSPAELDHGWRLVCQCELSGDLTLELRQWDAAILGDEGAFHFTPQPGLGVAVDLGTTTLVAQLLDLQTSQVLAVRSAVNSQARHGADVMSRVGFAVADNGQPLLEQMIRNQIGKLIRDLLFAGQAQASDIRSVVIVGNTVMHHLFCGVSVEPLSHVPFEPENDGLHIFRGADLGWSFAPDVTVRFLPCLGSFVGSDILAGIVATRVHQSDALVGLVDLGTNGEIVIGTRTGLLCASTAAGPAFEGARISMGMRAASGAISEVELVDDNGERRLDCRVLGNVTPAGICGSGLVDAVACGLDLGRVRSNGRLGGDGADWLLQAPVVLTQTDIRQLQLAKGAISAGIRILLARLGATTADLTRLYLAGAFGNYINRSSAQRIGLLPFPPEQVQPAGNTALLGAKMALFAGDDLEQYAAIRRMTRHIPLNEDPQFMDVYVDEMSFPEG